MRNKKLGIIGGMGARAGAHFLNKIIEYSPANKDQEFIEIILHNNSAIPDRTRAIVYYEPSPVKELLRSVKLFNENDVDAIVLTCITSYYYYKDLAPYANAPILHPVKLVRDHIFRTYGNIRKVGLLATTGTVKSRLFQNEFREVGVEVLVLNDADQENYFMRSVYMDGGLKSARILPRAKELFLQTLPKLLNKGAEVIIGGCSEVPLVLKPEMLSVPLVDSIDVLARETVSYCYSVSSQRIETN